MYRRADPKKYVELKAKIKSSREREIDLKELLDFHEVKVLIAEFLIYNRVQTLFISHAPIDARAHDALRNTQYNDQKQILIDKINSLNVCKKRNYQIDSISNAIKPILISSKLTKQKNDAWALQYLAHFFSTRNTVKLFFYTNPFINIKLQGIRPQKLGKPQQEVIDKINLTQSNYRFCTYFLYVGGINIITRIFLPNFFENIHLSLILHTAISMVIAYMFLSGAFMPKLLHSPFIPEAADMAIHLGLIDVIHLEHEKCVITFLVFYCASISLLDLHLVLFDNPIFNYLFDKVFPVLISLIATAKIFHPILQRSPFSWNAAGFATQISLMEEMNNFLFPSISDDMDLTQADSAAQKKIAATTEMLCISPRANVSSNDTLIAQEEKKLKIKRKAQSSTVQFLISLASAPDSVEVSWEDSAVEPLYGIIVKAKNNKAEIKFLPKAGVSHPWSGNSSVNETCKHDVFDQTAQQELNKEPIDETFANMISYAHVVAPTAHSGIVPVQKNDPDFDIKTYKYKVKPQTQYLAVVRVGMFHATSSKSIKYVDDSKRQLPENLKNTVYHVYKPGAQKRTH